MAALEVIFFKKRFAAERSHYCECSQLETVEHILRDCFLYPTKFSCLKSFPEIDLQALLDTKKGFCAVVKFLDSLPQLLCWSFAWLEQLFKVLLFVNL
jgi:hypothetical protein